MNRKLLSSEPRWWKGNLHMHSLWSDGDDFPEMVAAWYKAHGYHFLAFSEHDMSGGQEGDLWIDAASTPLKAYRARFRSRWVETRVHTDREQVRIKPLHEYRALLEQAGRFLLLPSEEITVRSPGDVANYLNATNIAAPVPPQTRPDSREAMTRAVAVVRKCAASQGRKAMVHLDHPNYQWNATAEDIAQVDDLKFMEVFTAYAGAWSYGDEFHASAERIWDVVLSLRLGVLGKGVIYGIASDDAHNYHENLAYAGPGRAWVSVRSTHLTPESLISAMARGDFYSSSGVTIEDVSSGPARLDLRIYPEPGVEYRTKFIGTRRGFDSSSEAVMFRGLDLAQSGEDCMSKSRNNENLVRTTRRYSDEVGQVLAEVRGTSPSYSLAGDELYVRATVISSKPHRYPHVPGDVKKAWTQPVVP